MTRVGEGRIAFIHSLSTISQSIVGGRPFFVLNKFAQCAKKLQGKESGGNYLSEEMSRASSTELIKPGHLGMSLFCVAK